VPCYQSQGPEQASLGRFDRHVSRQLAGLGEGQFVGVVVRVRSWHRQSAPTCQRLPFRASSSARTAAINQLCGCWTEDYSETPASLTCCEGGPSGSGDGGLLAHIRAGDRPDQLGENRLCAVVVDLAGARCMMPTAAVGEHQRADVDA
jgi:hypothetical protein